MGVNGIDWQGQLHGARSEMLSITLIYDGNFVIGETFAKLQAVGLLRTEEVTVA